jgi:peptidoglycan hydrolase-like protein with peptidoglycan-binding domain
VPEPLICVALTLEPGTRSNDVKNIQRWLISQGYTKVVATGLYDILTVRAVTHFQNEYAVTILAPLGLTQATGTWGEYTARQASRMGLCQFDDYADDSDLPVSVPASGRLPASSSYTNDAYPGVCLAKTMGLVGTQDARHNTREDVKKLQNFLRSRGYTKVEATGIYGPLTKRAIAHFQEEYAESILHPLGRKKGTGVWGVRTALLATELGLCEF